MSARTWSSSGPSTAKVTTRTAAVKPRHYSSNSGLRTLTAREKEARQLSKLSSCGPDGFGGVLGGGGGYGGYGGGSFGGGGTVMSAHQNSFSPQLSPDFLELPQSIRERREIYRHFYNSDELVGQAIDLHTELPLSKIRLSAPKPTTVPPGFEDAHDYGQYILSRFQKMCRKTKLFENLITIVHHYWLDGTVAIFAEDSEVDVPYEIGHTKKSFVVRSLDEEGNPQETPSIEWVPKDSRDDDELAFYQKNYMGWKNITVLPIDRVKITTYGYNTGYKVELIPSERDRVLVDKANQGDEGAVEMLEKVPADVRDHIENSGMIPLGTDPDEGSFVYILTGRKHADDQLGQSILDRCLRTLMYREKLRQAQTMIASRAMTPRRIVWAEGLGEEQVDLLREQVDMALMDPDYSIVANYEVRWEEMSSRDRLLDLSSEYEMTEKRLISGLGVTESLMSGESLYSGDRLKLEVINLRYLHLREIITSYVQENLFEPVARRMGFVEKNKWGEEVVLCPRLTFTRLPLRDSQDTFDSLFNLYQKGSVDIETILELLNLDPEAIKTKLENDLFTVNDSTFNEFVRGTASEASRELVEKFDLTSRLAKYLKLEAKPKEPESDDGGGGRF